VARTNGQLDKSVTAVQVGDQGDAVSADRESFQSPGIASQDVFGEDGVVALAKAELLVEGRMSGESQQLSASLERKERFTSVVLENTGHEFSLLT
jgi:hypothetical protein